MNRSGRATLEVAVIALIVALVVLSWRAMV